MTETSAILAALLLLSGCRAEAPTIGAANPEVSTPAAGPTPPAMPERRVKVDTRTLSPEVRSFSEPVPLLPMQIQEMTGLPGTRTYALTPPYYIVSPEGGGPLQVPVALERVGYHVRASVQYMGAVQQWADDAWCFDLHSTDPAHPYSHSFWLHRVEPFPKDAVEWPPPGMQFYGLGTGEKYLAGPDSAAGPWLLCVSQPVNKEASLQEYISRQMQRTRGNWIVTPLDNMGAIFYCGSAARRTIPWGRLFPGDAFSNASGTKRHLEIVDVSKDGVGNLVVSIAGLDPNKVFKAVFTGTEWYAGETETRSAPPPTP